MVDDIRVRAVGKCISHKEADLHLDTTQPTPDRVSTFFAKELGKLF